MGGRTGLKGTDGAEVLNAAKLMGASPESPRRAVEALRVLSRVSDQIEVFTYPQEMGEVEARQCSLSPTVLGSIKSGETTPEDTENAAKEMKSRGVDLLLFAGGDGTARDIYRAVGQELTVLGIPAGVKMHSAVYALTPKHAGEVAVNFLTSQVPNTTDAEVMDIDEESFRRNVVAAKLYGYLRIPEERQLIQNAKSAGNQTERQAMQGAANELIESMESDCLYIFGPGTTTRDILLNLGLTKTLLGVDVVLNKQLIAKDVNETQLIGLIKGRRAKIVVTVIGGQGYIFGRGNQQIGAEIIREVGSDNIILVASREKLASLHGKPLVVDTGSEVVDKMLSGYVRVRTGYGASAICKVTA
jgi:predicted polyphosphate/ATP-dependent NAD kinase